MSLTGFTTQRVYREAGVRREKRGLIWKGLDIVLWRAWRGAAIKAGGSAGIPDKKALPMHL
jgi:hypothetical protein